ncbi:MAG: TonB-dependent receptor [Ignavibacteriae bacterium]|nr:TonB-dependent receptor [Ignavibacteriota bacterium]
MMKHFFISYGLLLTLTFTAVSQDIRGTITGKVIDANSGKPMEYANIVLFQSVDSTQVTGTITNASGVFELANIPVGRYYLTIQFVGYERQLIDAIVMSESNLAVRLNDVLLAPTAILMQDVVVEGQRSPLSYQIDKKVIDVERLNTTLAGSAVDVLETIPSVSVDIEGNVSLRGRSNFTVLIDGKPTILDAQDALQQIPATSIASIEIITNPSAKYDPEGTAGIINIKLKKATAAGFGGMLNANGGLNDKYGGDVLLEYKSSNYNAFFGANYNNRFFPGTEQEERSYFYGDSSSFINSSGDTRRGRRFSGVRGAVEFNLSERDFLTVSGRYRTRDWSNTSRFFYDEWTEPNPQHVFRTNATDRGRNGESSEVGLDYRHRFSQSGHELVGYVQYESENSDELTVSELLQDQTLTSGRRTTERGPSSELESKFEYVLPFSDVSKFEAGYQGEVEFSNEITGLAEYNLNTGVYENLPQYSHDVKYEENQHALYSLYSGGAGSFGYQLGMRAEYTRNQTRLTNTGQEFLVDRWDYFPSVHTSYEFAEGKQIMASYTRRIDRPGGWQMEPFFTWLDANNVRIGNPALIPEFIDSYELAAQTYLGPVSLSGELYYSITHNKIEQVRSVYAESVTLRVPENIGRDYSLGTEFLLNFDVYKGWNVNLVGNVYDYRIEGSLFGEPFSQHSFNWRLRMNNVVKLGKSTEVQFSARFESPTVSAQGREKESIRSDFAIRQGFFNDRLSAILQMRNILNMNQEEFTSEGPGFRTFNFETRESPMVMLTLRFSLNQFEREDRENGEGNDAPEFDSER